MDKTVKTQTNLPVKICTLRYVITSGVCVCVQVNLHECLQFLIEKVLSYLGDSVSVIHREGAIETVACILAPAMLGV